MVKCRKIEYRTFKIISCDQIRELLREDLVELEKLVTTIPNSRDIIAVIDQSSVKMVATSEDREWCYQNRDKTVEVQFQEPQMFKVRAYDA